MNTDPDSASLSDLEDSPFGPFSDEPQPALRAERPIPITVSEAIAEADQLPPIGDGSEERPVFGVSQFDPATSPHPFDGCCKVCAVKDPPVITPLDLLWRNMDTKAKDGRWLFRGFLPVNCCDTCKDDASKDAELLAMQRAWWLSKCPVEFRDDWDNRKGDPKLLSRVLQFDPTAGRGLVIHGSTDACKTRAVWRLLRKLAEDGVEWLFIEAIDLLDSVPDRAFSVPVLVIDDLGNDHLKGQNEVRLLKLLRTRTNWHKPVVVTTQFTGDSLAKRFSETATAQAIIRRLRAFCDDIHARPNAGVSVGNYHG